MPRISTRARSLDLVSPLDGDGLAQAESVGLRLGEALRAFFAAVPGKDRSVREYAAFLGVDPTLCHRGLTAAEQSIRGLEVALRAPGSKGLELLLRAGERVKLSASRLRQLEVASRQLESLIDNHGRGSRRRLLRRIEATAAAGSPDQEISGSIRAGRVRLYKEAAQTTGYQCDVRAAIGIVWPIPHDQLKVNSVYLTGFLGYRARAGALPLTTELISKNSGKTVTNAPGGLGEAELVEHLCSTPLPYLSLRSRDGRTANVIDSPGHDARTGMDAVMAFACKPLEHPTIRPPEVFTNFVRIAPPTKRLVFDIYLHRDLAVGAIPHASAHAYGGGVNELIPSWDTLLPDPLLLQLLGEGYANASSRAWTRHAEATRWLFDRVNLDASMFVGYRLDVEYPVWAGDYGVLFDYRRRTQLAESP